MMSKYALIFVPLFMCGNSYAAEIKTKEVLSLAIAKNCTSCHSLKIRVVGPAFRDIALRYSNDNRAEYRLTEKILRGSIGSWGKVPMPANIQVSPSEARVLARWVLSIK